MKNLVANETTIPITINNGLSYTLDVRFTPIPEPATLGILGMGAVGLGLANQKRKYIVSREVKK